MKQTRDDISTPEGLEEYGRGEFVRRAISLGSLSLLAGVSALGLLKYLLPNVLYEPPTDFKVGLPAGFPEGVTPIQGHGVFLVRSGRAFHAISSVCPHLRCQVVHIRDGFRCPCHGSRFDMDGSVRKGPAPRSLDWYEVTLAEDGEIRICTGRRVKAGTRSKLLT